MILLDGITESMDMSLSKLQETGSGVLQSMVLQRAGHDRVTEQQHGYTTWSLFIHQLMDIWIISSFCLL